MPNNVTSTSISVKGDRQYVARMKMLAARRNTSLADLVRSGLDRVYANELQALDEFIHASDDANTHDIVDTSLTKDQPTTQGAELTHAG